MVEKEKTGKTAIRFSIASGAVRKLIYQPKNASFLSRVRLQVRLGFSFSFVLPPARPHAADENLLLSPSSCFLSWLCCCSPVCSLRRYCFLLQIQIQNRRRLLCPLLDLLTKAPPLESHDPDAPALSSSHSAISGRSGGSKKI
ncbi:unnamed protein product [Microthlaspi erraticum]|uniref:Uncharacterized protein n=1 Tax=Microthlaspi erraticum TaxID=1685480 RepID=A0A6D2IPL8_9BRAS|nr:unnamed protein product [Microthlaspi erraticum]